MQLKQQRKILLFLTISYSILVLYFMFFAFGRAGKAGHATEHTFMFLPDSFFKMPSLPDFLHPTLMDFVGIGNFIAFTPFGIFIPLLYRTSFVRFITVFILSIFVLETIQGITMLGSFDTNDVIQNAIGAAVGFGAYKLGFRTTNVWRNIAATGISIVVLMSGIWGCFVVVDKVFTKEMGPFIAIDELKGSAGNPAAGTKTSSLIIGGHNVKPQYNVYSTAGKMKETYTYTLGIEEEMYLFINYGISDQKGNYGSVSVSVDGNEYLSISAGDQGHEIGESEMYLPQANEIRITIEGNVTLWDVGYSKMKYFWE
ncbi:VanZ family protein [Paenibacillus sp. NPDC058177]|uniref:VanZ family protein n=1 Tax=Paenibacillus sp. NPDC058177 TaxID=3346369 RepID=UPI0036D91E0A